MIRFLIKASQLGLWGGETPIAAGRTGRAARTKPAGEAAPGLLPPGQGWRPIPGSKHGGMHRPKTGGGYDYWYPGTGVGNVHQDDAPAPAPAPEPPKPAPVTPPPPVSTTNTTSPGGVEPRAAALSPEGSPNSEPSQGDTRAAPPRVAPSRKPRAHKEKPKDEGPISTERHPLDIWPDQAGALRRGQSLQEAELAIANEPHEHACAFASDGRHLGRFDPVSTRRLAPRVDTRSTCAIPKEVQDALRADGNGIFTHNHPAGGLMSDHDVDMAIACNVREMRAVTREGVWIMSRPKKGWPSRGDARRGMELDIMVALQSAYSAMHKIIENAGGNVDDGYEAKGYSDEKWKELARAAVERAWVEGDYLPKYLPVRFEPHPARPELATAVRSPKARSKPGRELSKGGSLRLLVDLARLRKATQMGLFGGETAPGTAGDRAPLAKAQVHVRGHYAHDPHGGIHQVRAHSRYGPIPDGAAPFGPHANWLAAHNKLLAASTARLGEGRYAQARALYDLAHHVRWTHDATFDMSNRVQDDPGAPMHAEASRAYYTMYHPKERHPIELLHEVMEGRNKNGRATKVHKHFERDRDYKSASEAFATDRSALESWWRSKIASFEGNEELSKFVADTIEKWRGGAKVAPTDPNRCERCGGRGYLDAFKHVSGGECFECGGSGTKDSTMHEVLRKAMTLRMPMFDLEPLAKGTAGAGVLAVVGDGGTGDTWSVGVYNFRLSKGQSGVSILTVTGGNLPQPYHLVVRGRSDALAQSPGVAQAFSSGRVPEEGMFRREGLAPVRYGVA